MPEEHPGTDLHRLMEMGVPLLSFGGAGLAVIFWITGAPIDFRISILGCVLGSWLLAYLAWIRQKKDIVALTTPIYSFIFLAVPTDSFSSVILELLYAASLTILLVRLKYRFGKPRTAASDAKELEGPLNAYIGQTRDSFTGISPQAAHHAAVAFVRFAEGEYGEAARVAGIPAGQSRDIAKVPSLTRAFSIVNEHAMLLDQSLPRPEHYIRFAPEDSGMLAIPRVQSKDNESGFYNTLDNALLLLFSAAWNASEGDRPHLLAVQSFAQRLLGSK